MQNREHHTGQGLSAHILVNGTAVTLNFSQTPNSGVLDRVKGILADSVSESFICNRQPHIDNRILTQP